MKAKIVVDNSANRGEFNRAYKHYLEKTGKIHCSYCGYNKNEKNTSKSNGGNIDKCNGKRKGTNTRFPNWKLVSKNRKQWMKKPMRIKSGKLRWNNNTYIDITW